MNRPRDEILFVVGRKHGRDSKPLEHVQPAPRVLAIAADSVTFPVEGVDVVVENKPRDGIPPWQRWNDYGIGLFLEEKAELRQSIDAFAEVEKLVDKIIVVKAKMPNPDTSDAERKIDSLIYSFYGLTQEDIALIEAAS